MTRGERARTLEVLLRAIEARSEVMDLIAGSVSTPEAVARLRELLGADEAAAQLVLDLPMGYFTEETREKLRAELDGPR